MTLAAYIRQDLRARLLGSGAPVRLTLRELSRQYGVSLTPVREAVEGLIREKVLRKGANGRLAAVASRRRPPRERVVRPREREGRIAREVMQRSLRGDASYLREEAAAARYGVGRTALRQILNRLAGAGMLEHVPRRGWRVHPFREEEMEAYLEVREVMELKALDLALPRLKRDELERLLADNRPSGNGGPPHVDSELHHYLIGASGNRYIEDFFRRHGAYYTTLFYYAAQGAAVVSDMARQHREILDALLRGRVRRARRALSRHIRDQRPVLRKMMARLAALPVEKWPGIESLGDEPATSPPRAL